MIIIGTQGQGAKQGKGGVFWGRGRAGGGVSNGVHLAERKPWEEGRAQGWGYSGGLLLELDECACTCHRM